MNEKKAELIGRQLVMSAYSKFRRARTMHQRVIAAEHLRAVMDTYLYAAPDLEDAEYL